MPLSECFEQVDERGFDDCNVESLPVRGVVSLYELLAFHASIFQKGLGALNASEAKLTMEKPDTFVSVPALAFVLNELETLRDGCERHKLRSSAVHCKRIEDALRVSKQNTRCGALREMLGELRRRFEDDFRFQVFLHLSEEQADQFTNPLKHWEDVVARFPKVMHNVEECAKCFALERYGASVFHVLQVAEYGVIQIADLANASGDKPGWSSLSRLDKLLKNPYPQRDPLVQKHSKILEDVVPLAIVVKNNWRHKLDHVDNQIVWFDTDFSPHVAEEIIKATRGFMRKLALELPQ